MKKLFLVFLIPVFALGQRIPTSQLGAKRVRQNQITYLNLDTYFNTLNLQSNTSANFTLVGNAVSQWTDLSSNINHAVQATAGLKPTFPNNGIDGVKWDGVDDVLTLGSEISLTDFTIFIVFKDRSNPASTNVPLVGAASDNNGICYGNNYIATITNNNTEIATHQLGQLGLYKLLMVRRSGSTYTISINDRQLTKADVTQNLGTSALKIKNIGWMPATSVEGTCEIMAVCIHNTALTDQNVFDLSTAFYHRYPIIYNSLISLIGFGDSITQWFGIPGSVAALFPMPWVNNGYKGTTASNTSTTPYSGQDRWSLTVKTRPYKDLVYVFFGANDVTDANVNSSQFQTGMDAIVNGLITSGYSARNILICSVPYRQDYASTKAKVDACIVADSTVAVNRGTRYVNMMRPFINTGNPNGLMTDNLHPNVSGQALMITTIFNAFKGN